MASFAHVDLLPDAQLFHALRFSALHSLSVCPEGHNVFVRSDTTFAVLFLEEDVPDYVQVDINTGSFTP
jgi:hypothetical protein